MCSWSYGCWEEGWGEGTVREFGMDMYTRLYLKWIANRGLTYSTWNSAQYMWQTGWEGSLGKNGYMYTYIWLSPFAVYLKLSQHSLLIRYQFRSVAHLCPTFCDPMNRSTPGLPVHHQFPEFTQTHVHRVSDAIRPSHPLLSPSPPAPNPSQHQGLFQWVTSSHKVAKVLEFQLQHQSFQWTPRTGLL